MSKRRHGHRGDSGLHGKVEPPRNVLQVLIIGPRMIRYVLLLVLNVHEPELLEYRRHILSGKQRLAVPFVSPGHFFDPILNARVFGQAVLVDDRAVVDFNMLEKPGTRLEVVWNILSVFHPG